MSPPATRTRSHINQAKDAAARAASRAGVEVGELDAVDDLNAAARLLAAIWATGEDQPPVPTHMLRALSHNGNYVAGARDGDRLVGASVGFLARTEAGVKLHSHITGIAADAQGRSVGTALKQHQRHWALERAIDRITWTFDPLVRRNAWFNLAKLGASITDYRPNYYGSMDDGVNAGDETDRCVVEWNLTASRAERASEGVVRSDDATAMLAAGGEVVLRAGSQGRPQPNGASGSPRLCWVPEDIVIVRQRDPAVALEWRRALRAAFTDALRAGLAATGMTRDGWYVFTAAPA